MPIQKETACKSTTLKNIKYITNPEKTTDENGKQWVETYNMISDGLESPTVLYKEFQEVNKLWNKNKSFNERKYYHAVINFKGIENVTPKMAMEIGKSYLKHFYPNHQSVLAVHFDKKYCHIHICINSVDMETGKKIDRTDKELMDRKDYVNHIAFELYGIEPFNWRAAVNKKRKEEKEETIEVKGDNYNFAEQQMHKNNRISELDELREKILRTALESSNREEFEEKLWDKYSISMPRNTEKTVSFKYKEGKKGTVRGRTLGEYYTAEFIDKVLYYNQTQINKSENQEPKNLANLFNDIKKIAFERNYTLAQKYGLRMSRETFDKFSEPEIIVRVAFAFVKKQEQSGIKIEGNQVYICGIKVETDKRLQEMYDAGVEAEKCRKQYGCKTIREFEKKKDELENSLVEIKTELRKERKIEKELKNKLQRNESLYNAINIVYKGIGTNEEINHAKHILYRNGFKKEQFNSSSTVDEIFMRLHKSQNTMNEQINKVKEIYSRQKRLQDEIERFQSVIVGIYLVNSPKFYYGSNLAKGFEATHKIKQSNAEDNYNQMNVDNLIYLARERASGHNLNEKEQNKTQEIEM